jgi:hypothetical protein
MKHNLTLRPFKIGLQFKRLSKGSFRKGQKEALVGYRVPLRPLALLFLSCMCCCSETHGGFGDAANPRQTGST